MKKVILDGFIERYFLGGSIEAVTWTVDAGGTLSTSALSSDRNAFAHITTHGVDIPVGEYHIVDTHKLKQILRIMDDDIDVSLMFRPTDPDNPVAFKIKSGTTRTTFYLSDPAAMPAQAKLSHLPNFELSINMDKVAVDKFIKATAALSDESAFTIHHEDGKTQLILGYDPAINKNQIAIEVDSTGTLPDDYISFSSDFLRAMLSANKVHNSCKIHVSTKGLAKVELDVDGGDVEYILKQVRLV